MIRNWLTSAVITSFSVLCIGSAACAQSLRSPAVTCVPKAISIKGTWHCFVTPSVGESTDETFTITQTGNKFLSTDEDTSYRIFGTIEGSAISISRVVNGEVLEGFVMYAQGHIVSVGGSTNNGIVTVYHHSQNGIGSYNCSKQAS